MKARSQFANVMSAVRFTYNGNSMADQRATLFVMTGATIVLWGLWGFFGKLAMDKGMSPFAIFCFEIIASMLCVGLLIAVKTIYPRFVNTGLKDQWNLFGVLSGVGLALGLLFYYLALYRAEAGIVVPLTAAYPVVTAILSALLLREKLSPLQWMGIVCVIAGVMLLLYGGHAGSQANG